MSEEPPYPFVEVGVTIGTWGDVVLAYADTGFEGGLLVPSGYGREVVASPGETQLELPGGYLVDALIWRGTVLIGERELVADIMAYGDRYLLGRDVLDQCEVHFVFGREVRFRFA